MVSIPPEEGRLLDYAVIYTSNTANNLRTQLIRDQSFEIVFDYIGPKDQAVVQVLHTGKDSSAIEVSSFQASAA
jgi:hypothetical protein